MWTHVKLKPKNLKASKLAKCVVKQVKYNGHRFTAYAQSDGTLKCFESSGTIRQELEMSIKRPKIVEYDWYKKLQRIPPRSSVDGELYVPGGNAGDASHAIAECLPELEFMPFAVPWWVGRDCRDESLEWVKKVITFLNLPFATTYKLYPHETLESLCSDAVSLSIEGWVLKESNYIGWWKVKKQKEIDCIVTGFKEGAGKYLGLTGALKIGVYINNELVEIGSISGMDDKTRVEIDEKKDIGRVLEVEFQELGNKNRLIHAHFVRWRTDKETKDCVYTWDDLK